MKSWRENANLFANDKFKISTSSYTSIKNDIWLFEGIINGDLILERGEVNQTNNTFESIQLNPDDCTLIARRISDMTDEELKDMGISSTIGLTFGIKEPESFHDALYLLSIGVYPFDQSHFEAGEVIDAKEVE